MKKIILFLSILSFCFCAELRAVQEDVRKAVVKVYATSNKIDFFKPWQSEGNNPKYGSGCIISGNRILTNAHIVSDHTFIQVRKYNDSRKYTARLISIGHDCDLALLTVDDENYFDGVPSIKFGDLPFLQDTVNVLGYPIGGDKISITEGVVSRIEAQPYAHSGKRLLAVQIDAALNPGNSGGPVFQDDRLIGVAMQVITNSQNIGYIIPRPVIDHFLKDVEDKKYDGFPLLGVNFDSTENQSLRKYYGIEEEEGGILIFSILPFSGAQDFLEREDVVLALDDIPISVDGTFSFRDNERILMSHIITMKMIGEEIKVSLVRDRKKMDIYVPLRTLEKAIPEPYQVRRPKYYIFGGMIFSELTSDLVSKWDRSKYRGPIDYAYYEYGSGSLNKEQREDIVILLNVLPGEVNLDYHNYNHEIIKRVNGREIKSFEDLVLRLNEKDRVFSVIETEGERIIILENEECRNENDILMQRYNIPSPYSPDIAPLLSE